MWKANLRLLPQPQRIQHLFPDSHCWGPFVLLLVLLYQTQGKPTHLSLLFIHIWSMKNTSSLFCLDRHQESRGTHSSHLFPAGTEVTAQPCRSPNHREHRGPKGTPSLGWKVGHRIRALTIQGISSQILSFFHSDRFLYPEVWLRNPKIMEQVAPNFIYKFSI